MPKQHSQLIQQANNQLVSNHSLINHQDQTTLKQQLLQQIIEQESVILCVDALLHYAILSNASDIHCEPYLKLARIRIRVNGLLQILCHHSILFLTRVAARLKVMANLDSAERRSPQDGQISFMLEQRCYLFRLASLPINHGEKLVLRLLNSVNDLPKLTELGFTRSQLKCYNSGLKQPQGLILVTGPTGSGKSTTLYSGLNSINTTEKNIITIEDPIEVLIVGVNQTQINPKAGLNYATLMRALLRQDPDVMMIGEIRDTATAELTLESALTGHLVLASLHTKSCYETIFRLQQLSLPNYLIAASLSLIICQRLIRLLCDTCKQPIPTVKPHEEKNDYQAQGCKYCQNGYTKRIALYQCLTITPEIRQAILKKATLSDFKQLGLQQNCDSLFNEGIKLVKQGKTSLDEVKRVIDSDA